LKFESKTYEAQLKDQMSKKSSKMSSRRKKTVKPTSGMKDGKPSKMAEKS
jgi:hypothetical protein